MYQLKTRDLALYVFIPCHPYYQTLPPAEEEIAQLNSLKIVYLSSTTAKFWQSTCLNATGIATLFLKRCQ